MKYRTGEYQQIYDRERHRGWRRAIAGCVVITVASGVSSWGWMIPDEASPASIGWSAVGWLLILGVYLWEASYSAQRWHGEIVALEQRDDALRERQKSVDDLVAQTHVRTRTVTMRKKPKDA